MKSHSRNVSIPAAMHISTDKIPLKDRRAAIHEVIGLQFLRQELEYLEQGSARVNISLRALPGLRIMRGEVENARAIRTQSLLADGNDDLFLTFNLSGSFTMSQCGREVSLGCGDANIITCAERSVIERPSGNALGLRLSFAALASRVPHIEDALVHRLDKASEALALLRNYCDHLENDTVLESAELASAAVTHVYDLAALALGANSEAAEQSRRRGLRAASLHEIRLYILDNLERHQLTVGEIAARYRVTPRYIQRLFEQDGTTFSQFVQNERLERVHRALSDGRYAHRKIADIAYSNGFGDISHFNRVFRRHFGSSPSEVRASSFGASRAS